MPSPRTSDAREGDGWIVCQIGAREHYALPAALHGLGRLRALVTDLWSPPERLWSRALRAAAPRLVSRYEPALGDAAVIADTFPTLAARGAARLRRDRAQWPGMIAANARFDRFAAARLGEMRLDPSQPGVALCYSYAAARTLRVARRRGLAAILAQIDPGPVEAGLIAASAAREGLADRHEAPPESYWRCWREERELADMILVNSRWSRDCLVDDGADEGRIAVAPLMYRAPQPVAPPSFPLRFDAHHPLVVLFLGAFSARKGAAAVLGAAAALEGEPAQFLVVGRNEAGAAARKASPNIRFVDEVPRGETGRFYGQAHLFILPTRSDGFALTQLEAHAHGVPTLATRFCGDVVLHGESGLLLPDASAPALRDAILWALRNPRALAAMSARAITRAADFTPERVVEQILEIGREAARVRSRRG